MPYIKSSFIEDLLNRIDILDVLSDYTQLKKSGANYFGLSPFIKEKTPSFCVSVTKQRFTDYAASKSGNVVTFLMEHDSLSYTEAIEAIAKKYNMQVEYEEEQFAKKKLEREAKRKALRPVLMSAQRAFINEFNNLPEEHPAKIEVYQKRRYTKEQVAEWGIGYAPGGKFIYSKVYEVGLVTEAEAIGLINKSKQQDKLWNRVTYPIYDKNGLLIGFASRDLLGKKNTAKWMNPPESDIYQKADIWFGLNIAKKEIVKKEEAWIVEGYNDVIAWHDHGIDNTIAPCGTQIPDSLITNLKKICGKVVFCFDPDRAGIDAMLKHIPRFLKVGFRVEVLRMPSCDPDDFFRAYKIELSKEPNFFPKEFVTFKEDGFKILMEYILKGSDVSKAVGARELIEVIATLEDPGLKEIYTKWLQKESGVDRSTLKNWSKEFYEKNIKIENERYNRYELPEGVNVSFKDIQDDVYRYGLFQASNQIWLAIGDEGDRKIYFRSVSNFSVEIVQHMQDEKFPMKLLKIKNIHGLEKIFDVPSEQLNQPSKFDDAVTAHGNFFWDGGRNEFQKLRSYLFDKMGNGRKIDVLGWQPEGFWCWNNLVQVPGEKDIPIDDNGVFIFENVSYYVPSANKIYAQNIYKYDPQKRFKVIKAKQPFEVFVAQMLKVHRDHAISGILFTIASCFQDIVVAKADFFPIMFMYGPGSTGKDQLVKCMQGFFGIPQAAINLEADVSTVKAKIREFSAFVNSMGHLSEYKRGPHDGTLKGFWDRVGYKRATTESFFSTDNVPITSSTILTGNEYSDAEALLSRFFLNEMTKIVFTDDENKEYQVMNDMIKDGYSSYMYDIINHRKLFEENFKKNFSTYKDILAKRHPEVKSRILSNVAVMGATYHIFKDVLQFPFTFTEMEKHFDSAIELLWRKIASASVLTRFWDLFLASIRGPKHDRLQVRFDYKIEGNSLFFNFTNVYNKIQRQWWTQFKEGAPGKSTIKDQLEKDKAFMQYHLKGIRMDTGAFAKNSSAHEFNIRELELKDEFVMATEYQLNEGTIWDGQSPATPKSHKIEKEGSSGQTDMDFSGNERKKESDLPF